MSRGLFIVFVAVIQLMMCGCGFSPEEPRQSFRVAYNPYATVDWSTDHRCLTQFHDHAMSAERFERFLAQYDRAGYQAVSPLHYSGDPSHPKAWRQRYWPVSRYVPSATTDADLLERFANLRILIPGAEEVGFDHVLSPFLTEYIEKWEGKSRSDKYPFHYESTQVCLDRIREMGGLAVIAHPWEGLKHYDGYSGFQAIEVYSGYSNHKFNLGEREDTNPMFLQVWDRLLRNKSTRIWGIGVNDWFGPGHPELKEDFPGDIDSGKTVVLIKEWTLESLRESFEAGAMFAVKDLGIEKGDYPRIESIDITDDEIRVDTDGDVEWIADQTVHATGEVFSLENLPGSLKYIRAQVRNATGEVFVQPFTLEAR